MSAVPLRCARCRAEVGPTIHTVAGYEVRGFRSLAGRVQPALIQGHGESGEREYLRVTEPRLLWLCPSCAADPAALDELDLRWSEATAG